MIVVARLIYAFLCGVSDLRFKDGPGTLSWLWKQWEAWDSLERDNFEAGRGTWAQQHARMVLTPACPVLATVAAVIECSPTASSKLLKTLAAVKWPASKRKYVHGKSVTLGLQRPERVIVEDGAAFGP